MTSTITCAETRSSCRQENTLRWETTATTAGLPLWGFVDKRAIMGRPFLIYWSVNATSADYGQASFAKRLKSVLDTLEHLPSRTRWSRMLHTVH